jgi:hypothetical protein
MIEGQPSYLSWSVTNSGMEHVTDRFFVDLLIDGLVVERWFSRGISARESASITDWAELPSRTNLAAGNHVVALVVVQPGTIAGTTPTLTPARLPDLAPIADEGWPGPITATPYSGVNALGPLSISVPTYVSFAFENRGLASTPETVSVQLYRDGMLVSEQIVGGALAGTVFAPPE